MNEKLIVNRKREKCFYEAKFITHFWLWGKLSINMSTNNSEFLIFLTSKGAKNGFEKSWLRNQGKITVI